MNNPIIQFKDVFFSYEKIFVLENVSFKISKGEFIGIVGPNGGGKTTALKLMMGFIKQNKGNISLFGHSPLEMRTRIGYVPQVNSFDKQFPISALDVVLTGCTSKISPLGFMPKQIKEKALVALEQVGLIDYKNHLFGSLSGGQAQKTLIARALVSDPDLLLLDEPTANVDPYSEKSIIELLGKIKSKKTILIVTHDFEAIVKNVDRVLCFQRNVTSLRKEDVCKHFALGIYHPTPYRS